MEAHLFLLSIPTLVDTLEEELHICMKKFAVSSSGISKKGFERVVDLQLIQIKIIQSRLRQLHISKADPGQLDILLSKRAAPSTQAQEEEYLGRVALEHSSHGLSVSRC